MSTLRSISMVMVLPLLVAACAGSTGSVLSTPDLFDGHHAPTTMVSHPPDHSTQSVHAPITFVGQATDPQDGMLTGGSLVWTSDLAGTIGTGTMFDASLIAGVHTVTLTATDSLGLSGTALITLNVN